MVSVHAREMTMVELGESRRIMASQLRQPLIIGGKELDQR
jgi:hypothetical protein